MQSSDPLKDLELLIRSRYGLIVLETNEPERAATLLSHVADRLRLPTFTWTRTRGLRRVDRDGPVYNTQEPAAALAHIEQARFPAIYHFQELGPYLDDDFVAGKLRDATDAHATAGGAIVVSGSGITLPEALRPHAATVRLGGPTPAEYRDLVRHLVRDLSRTMPVQVRMPPADLERLVANLRGLTLLEAEKVLTRAIVEDGLLSPEDIGKVIEAKRAIVEREGLLEYYPAEESMDDIADLAGLKDWLRKRQAILADPERAARFGLTFPKGILLVGVPGCGKSLCAKAVAMEWKLPLLKLDTANLYNKYVGESERNFKRAFETAERMAPVVLWIDELEKAFATGGSDDGGLSMRVLGTVLSWMQDRKGDVFIVATANDVTRLPPEFLRKGRFDEIFFVDLPDAEARAAIFRIHLSRRGHDPGRFDLAELVRATDGFSGAEIEQAIVSALYTAFASGGALDTPLLLDEIRRTRPLSVTMAERVAALRRWAEGRTVSASG